MDEKEAETQNNTLTIEIPSETKDDIFDNIKEPRKEIEKHRRSIDRIFVSQYMDDTSTYNEVYSSDDYVVTYSKEDKSFLGWSVNTKNNGPQQPDVYFKADQIEDLNLRLGTLLSKKILSLYGYNKHWLIDLNSDRTNNERFLKLKQPVDCEKNIYQFFSNDAIGFLPNDLIQVSVRNRKIYKYCLKDRPINTVLWEYSQINDIEIPESLYGQVKNLRCTICRTKLFLIVKGCKTTILQFDLLKMNLERQYIANANSLSSMVVMNTNQTLLAYYCFIFSMKNGMLISYENYGEEPVEFITLKNNSERLVMNCYSNVHKLIDPYQAYDEIDISNDFNKTSVITKLNRKIFIDNGNVCVRNGSDENKLQQLSNEVIYRNSIYTSSVFNIIQSMFKEIIDRADIKKVASPDDKIKLKNRDLYEYILRPNDIYDEISFEHNDIISCCIPFPHILSYKLLNNQDLIIISMEAIEIFALLDKGFKNRYFWKNNDWNDIYKKFEKDRNSIYDINFVNEHYKPLIGRILKYEFNDSKDSIPLPNFMGQNTNHRKTIAEDVISDNLVSSKFGIEMLKIAIKENCDSVVRPIINNTIESIQNYSVNSMTFISLNLPKLCDDYPDYIIKYISYTSIILSPFCNNIRNSKNTSIHSYTNIYIKESHMDKNVFKAISSIYKWLIQHLRIKEEIQTVSFIVPFPQICVYQDDSKNNDHENHVNENNDHENENNDPENCDFNNNDYESHASKNNDHENHETENDDYENHDSKNNDHENLIESFGIYFAIIIGVAKRVFPFLVLLFFIVLGYAQAFFIVLKSNITNDGSDNLFNCYYDLPVTEARKLINAIDNEQTVFNYPPLISEELRNLVVLADDNNKLENKIDQTKEELKQQMEFIMKNIGVEKDNEEEQDSEEKEQENKLEKQMEQTKEELPKQHVGLKQQMDKHALQMDKLALQMDKLNQQMENIMELLLKRN
ncbi:4044_t:CDS:2 [Rhizophagus irregularis]|nr:4044_t:CDS:2 [Rhizophagus irregularis]